MPGQSRVTEMCDRICYRKYGETYECRREPEKGETEVCATGTREDILSWMAVHGWEYVSREILESDLDLLCREREDLPG